VRLSHSAQGQASPLDEQRLSISLELIEAQLSEDLTVRKMAQAVQMDPTNFAKKFRSATGSAPFAYLTERRMERARQLLRGKMSVTDVALAVGYSNPSKFAEAFRRKIGHSPAAWRQSLLE
jgi:AraC family transcriptional regulator